MCLLFYGALVSLGLYERRHSQDYITDEDKLILMRDERYRLINNDEFRVWRTSQPAEAEVAMPLRGKAVELPDDVELPTDLSQSAGSFLNQFCNKE